MRSVRSMIKALLSKVCSGMKASRGAVQSFESRLSWRALLLLGLGIAIAALVSSRLVHASLMQVLGAAEEVIRQYPAAGPAAFVGFSAISAMFAFLSTALIVPVAVLTWGSAGTMAMLWLGWILGGMASYGVARSFGRRLLDRLGGRGLLQQLERWVRPDMPFGWVLILQVALPSEIPGYLLGLVKYSPRKYCWALGLAELPYALATVYVGQGVIERRSGVILGVSAMVCALSLFAFYALRNKLSGVDGASAGNPDDCGTPASLGSGCM